MLAKHSFQWDAKRPVLSLRPERLKPKLQAHTDLSLPTVPPALLGIVRMVRRESVLKVECSEHTE